MKNDTFIANDLYDTNERIIGKWYNGKTLYSKCITFTDPVTAPITKSHGIQNVDMIFIKNAWFWSDGAKKSFQLPIIGYDGNWTDNVYAKVDSTNIYIYNYTGGWGYDWHKIFILIYTKNQ